MGVGYEMAWQLAEAIAGPDLQSEQACITAINSLVHSVRRRLNMEVGFVSEFAGGRRYFRYVDAAPDAGLLSVGDSDPLDDSYCQRVIDGRLPHILEDARSHPVAAGMDITHSLPVGSHLSVPIEMSDGSVFGTFCVFSRHVVPGINHRDLTLLRVFADVIASLIEDSRNSYVASAQRKEEMSGILDRDELMLYAQPIYNLSNMAIEGYELLARVASDQNFSPEIFFDHADQLGLSPTVGVRVVEKALQALRVLPEHTYVAINVTPDFILESELSGLFTPEESCRLVLELTEHHRVIDYIALQRKLQPLRDAGVRLAIDDAGAGYASMRHILQLSPDIMKLDISLIQRIHEQPDHQSLLAALQVFARTQGYTVVAEGIENSDELTYLCVSGIGCGQGYFLKEPQPLDYFTE